MLEVCECVGFSGAHFLLCPRSCLCCSFFRFLGGFGVVGLAVVEVYPACSAFWVWAACPLIFVAPCALLFLRFLLGLAPVDC